MAEHPRIEDLRRRVQKDPTSIAFAQLAEECRRAEEYQEAVDICRAGLALHPGYLSARLTLGRALIELDQLDDAQTELELVLASAPANLAAIRGLAEIFHRRGSLVEALRQYRAALALARNDPDLERTVTELAHSLDPKPAAPAIDGLSFDEMADEFTRSLRPAAAPPRPVPVAPPPEPSAPIAEAVPFGKEVAAGTEVAELPADDSARAQASDAEPESGAERTRAQLKIAALDQWLDAIHVTREQRRT
jgi:tetratricopeptide (TPR) repeat protein